LNRHLRNPRLLAGAALVALLLLVALWPRALPVDLATVARGPLQVTVEDEGETRVRDRFVVSAPVSGRLLRIELEPGDAVRKDQVILNLLPAQPTPLDARSRAEAEAAARAAQAAAGRARAENERAAAALAFARSELQRQRELARQGVVASQQLEAAQVAEQQAREAREAADVAVAAAQQDLRRAQARLIPPGGGAPGRHVTVRSPVDGVVLKRHHESETTVGAGEPLLELGDPKRLEIVSDLLSTDAVRVQAGAPVRIEQWGGEKPLLGRVKRVEPSGFMKVSALGVEEQRVNVIVDFEDLAEAWEALGDGYRVEVRIVVWEAPDTLKVPTGSLFRRGSDWAVFTVEGGRARLRTVELGQRNGMEAQVLAGVGLGDRIVVHPSDTLTDGTRVAPRSAT
jgi:HlyD family secretion protein